MTQRQPPIRSKAYRDGSRGQRYFYAIRGLQETMERRLHQGLLSMPADAKEASTAAPKRKMKSAKTTWPSQKMASGPFQRREK